MNRFAKGEEFGFVFLESGSATFVCAATTQKVVAGSILLFSGHSEGKLWAPDNKECRFTFFCVRFEHLLPIFSSYEMSRLHGFMAKLIAVRLYPPETPLQAECQGLLASADLLQSLNQRCRLLCVVAAILSEEFKEDQVRQRDMDWMEDRMTQVFEKLSSKELLRLNVEQLASKFNCSRRHLNRLFQKRFGCSFIAFRMELRMSMAVSLLMDPQAKIINVAEQSGFNAVGLFNLCFKRRYGTSPGQWRKAQLSREKPPLAKPGHEQTCVIGFKCPWGVGGATTPAPAAAGTVPAIVPKSAARLVASVPPRNHP